MKELNIHVISIHNRTRANNGQTNRLMLFIVTHMFVRIFYLDISYIYAKLNLRHPHIYSVFLWIPPEYIVK